MKLQNPGYVFCCPICSQFIEFIVNNDTVFLLTMVFLFIVKNVNCVLTNNWANYGVNIGFGSLPFVPLYAVVYSVFLFEIHFCSASYLLMYLLRVHDIIEPFCFYATKKLLSGRIST